MLDLLKNSFIAAILGFFLSYIFFYLAGIGYEIVINDEGKQERVMSFKYPLAFALFVWLLWYFYLFPPNKMVTPNKSENTVGSIKTQGDQGVLDIVGGSDGALSLENQKFDPQPWF